MRTSITIPDEYYLKIKADLANEGYTTLNDFVLDLLRHYYDDCDCEGVSDTPRPISE